MNRRTFVSSLAVAGTAAATGVRLFADQVKARPKVGLIGCGWFGVLDLTHLLRFAEVEVVSLCDVNTKALAQASEAVGKYQTTAPRSYTDFRAMLAATDHDIVIVATPDHWHALVAIAAMKAGADVFLEKPVGVDVMEGEALVAAARKYQRVVQVNTHRRSAAFNHRIRKDYIRSGRMGTIGLVESCCFLPMRLEDVIPAAEVPKYLDYEMWTGPAPFLPFRPLIESKGWRGFMEYGNGIIGDMGVHLVDHARWMLGLGWPDSIRSTGGIYMKTPSSSNISDTQRSVFGYPNFELSWEHRTWGLSPIPQRNWADQWLTRFIGQKGTLSVTMYGWEYLPADGGPREGFHLLSQTGNLDNLDFSREGACYDDTYKNHIEDFMKARRDRSRPVSDVEEGHISSACCELANLAQALGRPLAYDPKTRTIPGDAEATLRLARNYRGPWIHPTRETV